MKKLIFLLFLLINYTRAQDFDQAKIYINPGHGGHDSNDRFIPTTGFWESEGNLTKGRKLRDILRYYNADVAMSRTTNTSADDKRLSQIVAEANTVNADYFHSIHSNAFQGNANYTLLLFQGYDNNPTFAEAKEMGSYLCDEIYRAHRTTATYNRGDFDFYGTGGTPYLGVLNGLTMPGTLSEGSFHDYIPESWRLMNLDYREHEARAIARAFLTYFDVGEFTFGAIAGIVRDAVRRVDYYYISSTRDGKLPINNIKVTLAPGNLIYTGDANNNGFYVFDSLAPGDYHLVFEAPGYGKDSATVTVFANRTVFADSYLNPLIPETPQCVSVLWASPANLAIKCDPAQRATGYVVYISEDGIAFPDSVTSPTNEIIVSGLAENRVYYFKVKAINTHGSSPVTAEIFAGVSSYVEHQVLVVNGFDRQPNNRFNFLKKYGDPLNHAGLPFSCTLNEVVRQGKLLLNQFNTVIWILGDESTVDDTFDPVEQDSVESFLKNGGNLFVSGAEIGWDLEGKSGHATIRDKNFYHDYLKARYVNDAPYNQQSAYYAVEAMSGGIFAGIADFNFDNGSHGTYDVSWPDAIRAMNGAIEVLKFKNVPVDEGVAGVSFEGIFPGGSQAGKLVYLTVPFETIYPAETRVAIMDRVLNFFKGETWVRNQVNLQPGDFELYQNYPNPFNPSTTIHFFIAVSATVDLEIYNVLGEKVRTLLKDENYSQGKWRVTWDGNNSNNQSVPTGVYYYQLTTPGLKIVKKMMLVK